MDAKRKKNLEWSNSRSFEYLYSDKHVYIYEKYYVKMIWSEIRKTLSLAFYLNNIFT